MPRFFIDTDTGERQVRDEAGIDLICEADAEHEARILLLMLGHAEILNGRDRLFKAVVCNDAGRVVYSGEVILRT